MAAHAPRPTRHVHPSARPARIVEGGSAWNRIGQRAARFVTGRTSQSQRRQFFISRVEHRASRSYRSCGDISVEKLECKEEKRDAKNYSVLVVRRQGRRGHEFLYFNFQEFKSWESYSIWRGRTRTKGDGNVGDVPARGTRIHGSQRRSAIHVHASYIILRELRD